MLIFIVFYTRAVKPKACVQLEHLGLRAENPEKSLKAIIKDASDPPRTSEGMLVVEGKGNRSRRMTKKIRMKYCRHGGQGGVLISQTCQY